MKKINITAIEKVTAAISAVEEKSKVRKLDPDFVISAVKRAEKHLSTLLLKKDWKGIQVKVDQAGGERFPASYNGVPESTQVTIEFSGSAWFVIAVERTYVYKREVDVLNLAQKKDELLHFALERNTAA